MRVECEVEETVLDGEYADVAGVRVVCSRCGHETESYGIEDVSVRRCLALMREECPKDESNFYSGRAVGDA